MLNSGKTEKLAAAAIKTVYRRELPSNLISFSSTEGKTYYLSYMSNFED